MQRLEVGCAVRRIYTSLDAKGLNLVTEKAIAWLGIFTKTKKQTIVFNEASYLTPL